MKKIIELTKEKKSIDDKTKYPNILIGKLVENFKMSNEIKNQHFNLKLIITIHILLLHITINKQTKRKKNPNEQITIQTHMQISETSCVFLFLMTIFLKTKNKPKHI